MRDSLIFGQRAAECREQADAARLDNVRDRCLRAEAAWSAMAQRSLRTETARDAREAATVSAEHAAHDSNSPSLTVATRQG